MMFVAYAALFALTFASVHPLCQPDQWEGTLESVIDYANEYNYGIEKDYTVVHYDYTNKRSAYEVQKFENGGLKSIKRIVTLGDNDTVEVYMLTYYPEDICTKFSLTKPFERYCVADGAKRGADMFLGGAGNLNVTTYYLYQGGVTTMSVFHVVDGAAVPVLETIQGGINNYNVLQAILFQNINPGIKDESIFSVPKDCKGLMPNDPQIYKDQLLTRDYYMMAH